MKMDFKSNFDAKQQQQQNHNKTLETKINCINDHLTSNSIKIERKKQIKKQTEVCNKIYGKEKPLKSRLRNTMLINWHNKLAHLDLVSLYTQ